ncbi:MAG: M24 family metallopeptidase [Bacteroidales bacterium]|nr:M24 family metallopeptidase [Bacteroidales bacterium]
MFEYQVAAELTYSFLNQGADGHAYEPIAANGENACVLHYVTKQDRLQNGDLILLDFGAELNCYASDCSRTIPVNGKFTDRQKQLYQANLRVFKYARQLMKPGETINIIHDEVCKMWEEEHLGLGLYTREEAKKHAGDPCWKKYYMHGTSHFMGMDVHDVGTKQMVLQPGMILTCEPGIYVREEKTGIRIENDILITDKGFEDLMQGIAIEASEIEKRMAQG